MRTSLTIAATQSYSSPHANYCSKANSQSGAKSVMDTELRADAIERIISHSGALFRNVNLQRAPTWLKIELTMPQLKALMCVASTDSSTSGQIARGLGVGLSTITGIVDRLAEQNLVTRREDPADRRITRVLPTAEGRALVDELLRYRQEALTEILSRLEDERLRAVDAAFGYLLEAATATREREEVSA